MHLRWVDHLMIILATDAILFMKKIDKTKETVTSVLFNLNMVLLNGCIYLIPVSLYFRRRYAKTIKRPFELTYDPYTQTVEVLDTPKQVASAMRDVMERLSVIISAMDKMQIAT